MIKLNFPLITTLSLATITFGCGAILVSSYTSAASTSANASVTVGSACSLTSSGNNNHTATISPGNYTADIGTTTITVTCNDPGGYALYAIGYTNDTYGTTTLNGTGSGQTIATGTATGNNSSDPSNWAMKVNKVTDSSSYLPANLTITNSFDSYHAAPSTYTKVANYTSVTDTTLGSKLTTTYAAYIKGDQAADTYAGKVKYTMVHPSTEIPAQPQISAANKICYYPNGSNVVGTMGCQTVSTSATVATLLANNYSRAGYGFAGWSDSFDYETNPNAQLYGPSETISFEAGTYNAPNNGLSLYAMWVKSRGFFQDSSKVSSICNNLTQSGPNITKTMDSVSALTDQRDNETYAIAKLADGNCWMIENLRLENTNNDNGIGALAQGYGTSITYGNFSGLANSENANFTSDISSATAATTENSLYYADTKTGSATINISQTNYAGLRMPRYNNYNHQTTSANRPQNPTYNGASNSTTKAGMYGYGNYYTWAAAIANTSYFDTTTVDSNGYTPSEAANTSLCPSGWRLPYGRKDGKGDTSGGFSYLDKQLGGTGNTSASDTTPTGWNMSVAWRSYPNNFLYSGHFETSNVSGKGEGGEYWSSTAEDYRFASRIALDFISVYPGTIRYSKNIGLSIRCVASGS